MGDLSRQKLSGRDNLVMKSTSHNAESRLAAFTALGFFFLGAVILLKHEMWRDEVQGWLLARDSSSVAELFANLKYTGHPGLWFLLVMPLTRVTTSPTAMQALHLLVATSTIYLFARYSPFMPLQKLLFSFGYFPFYEYSIVARNYALGVLFIFAFTSLFDIRYARFIAVGLVLFLLSHTSVFGLIIAIVLFFALLIDFFYYATGGTARVFSIYIGFAIIVLGIVSAVLQLIPPPDSIFVTSWHLFDLARFKYTATQPLAGAYVPIPPWDLHFWNDYAWRSDSHVRYLTVRLVWVFLAFSMLVFVRKPLVFFVFVGCTSGLLAFFYLKHHAGSRHSGFIFITFIMSAWLYRCRNQPKLETFLPIPVRTWEILFNRALTALLVLHIAGSFVAASIDFRYPFSAAKSVAEYINVRGLKNSLIVGYPDTTSAIVGYLGIREAYYPQDDRFGSYINYKGDKKRTTITQKEAIDRAFHLKADKTHSNDNVLIILGQPLEDSVQANKLHKLVEFTQTVVDDESFYIYRLNTD
jgi:hypothetical protein